MSNFAEQIRIEELARKCPGFARVRTLETVVAKGREFPIYAFEIGSQDPEAPVFALFGGVHGLERVGTHVALAYLESLFAQAEWDKDLRKRFETCRIVSIPLINPAGMFFGQRSNMNGIDLMRNSPTRSKESVPYLLGGHHIGPNLPWYMGPEGSTEMELEAQVLVNFVKEQCFQSKAVLCLDIHSGFGMKDRLWYPYAKTAEAFPALPEVQNVRRLLDLSYPNHIYAVEPQSESYTTHGDLWDYIFDEHLATNLDFKRAFIPWTLEIGSWLWIRKNPRQLFSALGPFNPIKIHRHRRTMRRHLPLLDFFLRSVSNYQSWIRK
ncbi:DUF2817 domain-containing protein [bacterium]|nr:DUF2817 domain-containing protein [bacterium]